MLETAAEYGLSVSRISAIATNQRRRVNMARATVGLPPEKPHRPRRRDNAAWKSETHH